MTAPRRFVFCVVGGEEQLSRLRWALAALRPRTEAEIVLVSDRRRTPGSLPELPCLDLPAPAGLSDRAAVIWLKTRLADLFPEGTSCYLDTDLEARGRSVDRVFEHFHEPVMFASDLTSPGASLRSFSRHAVRCACHTEGERLERFAAGVEDLTRFHARRAAELARLADETLYRAPVFRGRRRLGRWGRWWRGEASGRSPDGAIAWRQRFAGGLPVEIRWRFAGESWELVRRGDVQWWQHPSGAQLAWHLPHLPETQAAWQPEGDRADAGDGYWESPSGESFRRLPSPAGEELHWYADGRPRRRWEPDAGHPHGGRWLDAAGCDLGECDHLAELLERELGVAVPRRDWVPWNGGLFLFSGDSRELLHAWWRDCEQLWQAPEAIERDQGALVATAWRLGLADHPRLPQPFNWIVPPRHRPPEPWPEELAFVHWIGGGPEAETGGIGT